MYLVITFVFQIFAFHSAKEKNIGRCISHVQIILNGVHCIEGYANKDIVYYFVRIK